MKEKILPFIIGVLVGAIIATGGFYLFSKSNHKHNGMPDGNFPQMMQQDGDNSNGSTPPTKPDGDNSTNKKKPSEKSTNTDNSTNESNEKQG